MCAWFGCKKHGVPGQACRLFERYLFSVLHNCVERGDDFRRCLLAEVPILIASCISLSAKMSNSALMLHPKVIKIILLCKNIRTTIDEIIATEFKVFRILDFRVPMWTSVEVGEMLAVKAGFPVTMLERVALVVDVAEFHRNIIDRKVKHAAYGKEQLSSLGISRVLSLHLTAGAVAATARLGHYDEPEGVRLLAQLTKAPPLYIECIQDIICAEILSPQSPI
ncbi:uncharacterized protein [Epargyreus clarus]|uniref:uncharacterized protein n=1 Tax=Epargyreus clarus TaxID=520877 RepID=UPI003C304824